MLALLFVLPARADDREDLWAAAKKGDAKAVEAILARGVDVNAKTPYGATALFYAADKGNLEAVKVLLKHKAEPNAKDTFYKSTPLLWALLNNHFDVAIALVEAGAKDSETGLILAARAGQAAVAKTILEKTKPTATTLASALSVTPKDHPEIVELLKKAGAKPSSAAGEPVMDANVLKKFEGVYGNENGVEYAIVLAEGKLHVRLGGQELYVLQPAGKSFKGVGEDATLTFKQDGDKIGGLTLKAGGVDTEFKRLAAPRVAARAEERPTGIIAPQNWPSFRGPGASGIADGQQPPTSWDAEKGIGIRWKTPIPGIGHSCPVIWGDRIFVTTAVSGDPKATIKPGLYGDVTSVVDNTVHSWRVLCLNRHDGKVLWEREAYSGVPKVKRHLKGSHANCTPASDGRHLVVCFGSEGLYCYDLEGNLLWKRDLGVLDSGFFFDSDYQWGFGSSPLIYGDTVILQCDTGKNSFIAAYRLSDGNRVWSTPRDEIPSWGTPTVVEANGRADLVTNGTKFARGYDPATGKEIWRLGKNAEITVPTPIFGQGLIFVTSGYRPIQPIYAVKPGATGDISPKDGKDSDKLLAWSKKKGGPYMPTPIVYGDYLYACSNSGIVTCYDAKTGKEVYKERLPGRGGYTASPVAADGKLYFTSEESGVRVVKAGPKFQVLAANAMGDVCMATPAISDGMIFVRTLHALYGIGRSAGIPPGPNAGAQSLKSNGDKKAAGSKQ
jgi:outer membrane protein assembly factor BamB